jgi:hypothetical protein
MAAAALPAVQQLRAGLPNFQFGLMTLSGIVPVR